MFFIIVHCFEVKSNVSQEVIVNSVLLRPPDTYIFPTEIFEILQEIVKIHNS